MIYINKTSEVSRHLNEASLPTKLATICYYVAWLHQTCTSCTLWFVNKDLNASEKHLIYLKLPDQM